MPSHLMPKGRVLGLKPAIRLESHGQNGKDEAEQANILR
jgi:hypothetical protein